jgi:acetyl esterase
MTDPDYQTLIDAPTWAFIRESEGWYPPEAAGFSIAEQRAVYDRMCRAFDAPYPPGVTARDEMVAGVPCRRYAPPKTGAATVIYFHGGGFVVGGLHSHDAICADICGATGLTVVSVDYRLSPDHLHPAAYEDARAVTGALAGPLVLAGDSAGGNLAAAVAHGARGEDLGISGVALIYPGLGGDRTRGSYVTHAHAPMLTAGDVEFYAGIRFPGGAAPRHEDPSASPLKDRDFRGLPPVWASAAECDPLADDAVDYAARIVAAGGAARAVVEPGLVHGWLRARHRVPRAAEAFARVAEAIAALAATGRLS